MSGGPWGRGWGRHEDWHAWRRTLLRREQWRRRVRMHARYGARRHRAARLRGKSGGYPSSRRPAARYGARRHRAAGLREVSGGYPSSRRPAACTQAPARAAAFAAPAAFGTLATKAGSHRREDLLQAVALLLPPRGLPSRHRLLSRLWRSCSRCSRCRRRRQRLGAATCALQRVRLKLRLRHLELLHSDKDRGRRVIPGVIV